MPNLLNGENTGVRVEERPTDFHAGAETAIVYEIRNPSGDWEQYKPTDEWQRRFVAPETLGYDTESCTNFSCMNSIELQLGFLLSQNKIPADSVQKMHDLGYFDANGNVNFSDWFSALTSGTTFEAGNTLQAGWDAVRKYGILPQSDGFSVNDFTDEKQWFDKTKITPEMYAKALKFLDLFDVQYEFIARDAHAFHLKQSPLQILIPTCGSWNNKDQILPDCGVLSVNHAITKLAETLQYNKVFDHYVQFVKKLAPSYYIPYAVKGVVSVKGPKPPVIPFTYTFNVNLTYGMPATTEVHKLQEALQYLKYMAVGQFGPYGPATKAAVANFQKTAGIVDDGSNFGPKTRLALNNRVKQLASL